MSAEDGRERPLSPEASVRKELISHLPPDFFERSPARIVYLILALTFMAVHLVVTSFWLRGRIPGLAYGITLLVASYCYPWFMFFIHELEHGAILPKGPLKSLAGWGAGFWLLFQPTFWARMHAHHHVHTNHKSDTHRLRDQSAPDFGARFVDFRLSNPIAYLSSVFALQILYGFCVIQFFRRKVRYAVSGRKVAVDLILHATLLGALFFWLGREVVVAGAVPVIFLGSLLMNGYLITQHLTRPMVDELDALKTGVSVWVYRGHSQMDVGRHVEHHLFPTVSHKKLRWVSTLLRRHYGNQFREKHILRAIVELFGLPSYYEHPDVLTNRKGVLHIQID